MEMQELDITIDTEGKVSIKVKGVKGTQCVELTRQLEELLGEVEERTYTGEYYEQNLNISQVERLRRK